MKTTPITQTPSPVNKILRPISVLVVDGDATRAAETAELLALYSHAPRIAPDGMDALAAAIRRPFEVAVISLDLCGEIDATDLAIRLRAWPATRKAILIAASGGESRIDLKKLYAVGFDRCVALPFDPVKLNGTVCLARLKSRAVRSTPIPSDDTVWDHAAI